MKLGKQLITVIDNYYSDMYGPLNETEQAVDSSDMIDNFYRDKYGPFERK